MKFDGEKPNWLVLEEAESTQNVAAEQILKDDKITVVLAHRQTKGRGRFEREWVSGEGDSLTFSLIFREYANWTAPHLVGMAAALAAAGACHCRLQWPNDLTWKRAKLGGILTEILPDSQGNRIPVVGIGVNLNQTEFFTEFAREATSLFLLDGQVRDATVIAESIVSRLSMIPEPVSWSNLEEAWIAFDETPGKKYKTHDGRVCTAISIGSDGQLIGSIDGETTAIYAADALGAGGV